jgi:hypothetical protein
MKAIICLVLGIVAGVVLSGLFNSRPCGRQSIEVLSYMPTGTWRPFYARQDVWRPGLYLGARHDRFESWRHSWRR